MLKFTGIITGTISLFLLIALYFNIFFTKGNIYNYKRTELNIWDNSLIAITEYHDSKDKTSYRVEFRKKKQKDWNYLTLKYNEKPLVFLSNNKLIIIIGEEEEWNVQAWESVNGPYQCKFFKSKKEAIHDMKGDGQNDY